MKINGNSPFGYTHEEIDVAQMCPYCYNEDTQRIWDERKLPAYHDHYKGLKFKAFTCYCCKSEFSFKC